MAAAQVYGQTSSGAATARTEADIRRFFDGFDLVEPGLVSVTDWRLRRRPRSSPDAPTVLYAGVGRKPH